MPGFLLALVGLLVYSKRKKTGLALLIVGLVSLYLFCFLPFTHLLIRGLERYPPLLPTELDTRAEAIVVLSAGSLFDAAEYGMPVDASWSLERDQYAAFLHYKTGLPILTSGGITTGITVSEAEVMASTLSKMFFVSEIWQEPASLNTAENAIYSAKLLKEKGITNVLLVTHAWHMPRAVMMFEANGINVIPAPTRISSSPDYADPTTYLANAGALLKSRLAMHEYVGLIWYQIRYL